MNNPNSVYAHSDGRLWVSDFTNRRVLRFDNAAGSANGDPADGVLGQPNFTTNTATLTQNGFSTTRFVTGDRTGRIYVVEEANNRVMLFNSAAGLANGANADYVLGQSTFTTNAAPNPPNASSLATPRAAVVNNVSGHLWVADFANNRVVRYNVSSLVSVRLGSFPVTKFELQQNYPNPFNPTTNIKYQIPNSNHVSLKVFDMLGREVATLVDEPKSAGTYTVDFAATKLSSGVYYYRLTAGSFAQTKKMIFTK